MKKRKQKIKEKNLKREKIGLKSYFCYQYYACVKDYFS